MLEKRTISLPAEHASYIDAVVASGSYASASEVVRAGLRALQEHDAFIEHWLVTHVAPVHDAMKANPKRGIPMDKVFQKIRAHHTLLVKKAKRDS